ncbi:metallophosphoesterase [Sutterella sp.]|uniref:metallophosphoesterase n=1 Tax=Sutterella sp. TaxID=1981025 RepID=UPI0026E053EF|nr:metallophosphoesterase [Sutterella sp.]MDO5530872.1 metallophosphoesterase [Sutterella sp.]
MRFSLFHFIMAAWVLWRFVLPLDVPRNVKRALAALTLFCAFFSTFSTLFGGGLVSPELPRWLLIAGNYGEGVLLFLCALTLLREAVIFFSVLAGRSGEKVHDAVQKSRRTAIGMGLASAALALYGENRGIEVPEVRRHVIPVKDLPEALEGFEIVQLSDTHCSAMMYEPWTRAMVERINALNPELVVITGDFVDGMVERRERDVAPFAELRARSGVWGCEGNHEHYGDYDAWIAKLKSLGIRLLQNEHAVVDVRGKGGAPAQIVLGGVRDPMAQRFGRILPDARATFEGAPAADEVPRILLAHQPGYFKQYLAETDFALQLSGHTHGGQILGMDLLVGLMNRTYVRGLYEGPRGARLYVHPGSGLWNGFPMRVGVPSEIALLELRRA